MRLTVLIVPRPVVTAPSRVPKIAGTSPGGATAGCAASVVPDGIDQF